MKNQVSLCMIVKNEEKHLGKCLNSICDIVDEIIIVDTGSTDKTIEIAKSFGAKVYYFKWVDDFSKARNESLKYASKDWIFILDGDDELYEEDRKNLKLLLDCDLDENAIYYFETLSYYGSSSLNGDIAINLNPRLFKNNRGIYYKGEVHNQLVYENGEYSAICDEIKIHHYGYLDEMIISKDKRNRNIELLKKQIKNNVNKGFSYFNLGNEYAALDDYKSANECYYKSYEDFNPSSGYSFSLILRIIIANYNLEEYDEALKFIHIGKKFYPKGTDLYFYEALIWKTLDRPTLQIKALEKSIEIGEPPSNLKFINGVGSFKAYYELGEVYMKYKDYDTAYNCYIESMSSKPDYIHPLYKIANILKVQNVPFEEFKTVIERFFEENIKNNYMLIADVFYDVGYYASALEYINKYTKIKDTTEKILTLKMKCLIRNGDFKEVIELENFNVSVLLYKALCELLLSDYDRAISFLIKVNLEELSSLDKKKAEVYAELIKLFKNQQPSILSKNENDLEYINIIFEILEILLINNMLDEFDAAVNLLNLIDPKYTLINLGKLYYKHGYIDIAKKEILRSIKEFDVYDNEGLDILRK